MKRRKLVSVFAATVFALSWAGPVFAGENRYLDAVLDIMPDMGDRFESVDELIKEAKWDRALDKLDAIVEEAGDTVWSVDGRVYMSVRDYITRRILAMPPEGLAFYRLRYDPEAQALFEAGLARQDVAVLDEVEARYPAATFAGLALDASASLLIDRGNYAAAAARLKRLVSRPRARAASEAETRLRAVALAKLGFCMAKLGDAAGARAAIDQLRKLQFKGTVRLGAGREDPLSFVRAVLKRGAPARAREPQMAWPSAGGHLAHTVPMLDVGPNLSKRWTVRIGDDSKPKKVDPRYRAAYYRHTGGNLVMQTSPLPVSDAEGVVYINTGKGLFALEHITGRRRWAARPPSAPVPVQQPGVMRIAFYNRTVAATWYRWQGATTATVGGGKVFAVEVLGQGYQSYLALSAFDASSGRRLWSFKQRPDGGDFEGQAYFPWAPKYVDGQLVGLACQRDEMYACALDAATGKVKWKVFLAADPVRQMNIYGRFNFLAKLGQPVVIADGTAYAATGMGAVAAVDIREGRLRWVSKYPRSAVRVQKQPANRPGGYTRYSYSGSWKGGFPVVSRGKLYLAAWDSNELLVFDCGTGAILKRIPRGKFTHFAGIHNGDVILVGPEETAAIDPTTGLLRWLVAMPRMFEPQGLPVITESSVLIPARGRLCVVGLDGAVTRRIETIPGANTSFPLGNIVSCDGRLIAANRAFATGYFSFEETYAYLSKQIAEHPRVAKAMIDRGDLSFLHASAEKTHSGKLKKYTDALKDFQMAEMVIGTQRPTDKALASRLRRMIFETRLKLSEVDRAKAVVHIDAARQYIFNEKARARFHLARGAALAAVRRYQDAVDEYLAVARNMGDVRLEEDESSVPVGLTAQARVRDLVEKHGEGVYARVDAKLKPQFDKFVRERDEAGLRKIQLDHPYSSLADNCLLEIARIVEKQKFGALRAQTLLRSITFRYPRSEVLGKAYAMLLANCIQSSQYRYAALALKDIEEKHPLLVIPWESRQVKGRDLVARLTQLKEIKQAASALGRAVPVILPPMKLAWKAGERPEVFATVVSDDNCLDRGIGLAAEVALGQPPYQYYGKVQALRAFDTATGQTLWRAKAGVAWCLGDIETGLSPWTRGKFRAIVVCSGNVVALCHPRGIMAFDLGSGRPLWTKKWTRPASRNPMQWFNTALVRDYRIRMAINQRPVFAAEGGRIFYYIPDGTLVCVDAASGKNIWRAKHAGYACGPIGVMGDLVIVATVQPNEVTAYSSALNGKVLYTKKLPGQFPRHPTYDRTRNRILLTDGNNLFCHRATDFKRLWRTNEAGAQIYTGQPPCIKLLPDNRIAVTSHVRQGNRYGYGLTLYNGENGKRLWRYSVDKYVRNKTGYTRTNMIYEPIIGKTFALIPAQTYKSVRQGRRYTQQRTMAMYRLDLVSGKKLGETKLQMAGRSSRYYMQFISAVPTAEHAVLVFREYTGRAYQAKMQLVESKSGKILLSEKLPTNVFTGRYQNLMQQRVRPLVTVDGSLLVPTGKGITCYRSGGTGKPEAK